MSTNIGTQVVGALSRIDDRRGAVRVEAVYDTAVDDLWDAVTSPARLSRWIATVAGDIGVGRTVSAAFTSGWEGSLRIDACDEPHHVRVTAEPGSGEETVMEAWLTSVDDRTRLVVEERGLPIGVLPGHGAGWQAHLEDLAHHLRGGASRWASRWRELTPVYETVEIAEHG